MIVLGLAGQAGAGKDTVADYLVKTFGFVKFAFSDALYAEVQQAFGLPDQNLLRNRDTKEISNGALRLDACKDDAFVVVACRALDIPVEDAGAIVLSPRQLLELWGTEYRRAQNPHYWLDRAEDFIFGLRGMFPYAERAPQYFVECGTRFENEREWITSGAYGGLFSGSIWHIRNSRVQSSSNHESAKPLPVLDGERELFNNDTIERLHKGIDLMMTTDSRFVAVEPMAPVVAPDILAEAAHE